MMQATLFILAILSSHFAFEGPVQVGGREGVQLGGGLAFGGDRMHRIDRMKA